MKGLTKKQHSVLSYIQEFINSKEYSPSFREIQKHFGFSSLGSVYNYIKTLKKKGYLSSEKYSGRSCKPTSPDESNLPSMEQTLPLIGKVTAGAPLETFPQTQTIAVPEYLVHEPDYTYVLRAKGNSMQEDLIADNDLLIVEARQEAHSGDVCVMTIEQQFTYVKKYQLNGQGVDLLNLGNEECFGTFSIEEVSIQGIVIGILRIM